MIRPAAGRRARTLALALGLSAGLSGCQDSIVDLSTVDDDELNDQASVGPLVSGMALTLSTAVGFLSQTGLIASREMAYGGAGEDLGATLAQAAGDLTPVDSDRHWNAAHQARWAAEDGVRRIRAILGEEEFGRSGSAAEALLYVGFSNRLLGENMCAAVIDGGPPEPRVVHFQRAAAAFTEALEIAERIGDAALADAARAGRASARVGLGDWAGARSDAEAVPAGFAFQVRFDGGEDARSNRVAAGTSVVQRAHTAWGTFYQSYFEATADPRVSWGTDPANPETRNGLPWLFQTKYDDRETPIDLVTWEEMRLIVAEAALRSGDVTGALAEIDALRAAAGVDPWPADDLASAWTALKRERGIELWLEARRLWDLHRWIEEGTPGEAEDMTDRDTCFPIGAIEQGTNPNVP